MTGTLTATLRNLWNKQMVAESLRGHATLPATFETDLDAHVQTIMRAVASEQGIQATKANLQKLPATTELGLEAQRCYQSMCTWLGSINSEFNR